jgi:hypothetical protein
MIQRRFPLAAFCLVVATVVPLGGCSTKEDPSPSSPEAGRGGEAAEGDGSVAARTSTSDPRMKQAAEAKDALMSRLSGRLMEVLQSDGPAAAIHVCSQEAVQIADAVGDEHNVAIGRTSFKLRNPDNAPRDWVRPIVENRVETPQRVELDDGRLGAAFPIRLDVKCLMCHGQSDDILDAVKPELAKRYPNDAATGFEQGELRGWFWVEVPRES